jgi:predicted GNAT family acetyltransferase
MLLNNILRRTGGRFGLLNCRTYSVINSSIESLSAQNVQHHKEENEFRIEVTGHKPAFLRYHKMSSDELDVYTTVVPPSMKGKGVAKLLAKAAIQFAREENLPVRPTCWYVEGYLARYPEPGLKIIPLKKD